MKKELRIAQFNRRANGILCMTIAVWDLTLVHARDKRHFQKHNARQIRDVRKYLRSTQRTVDFKLLAMPTVEEAKKIVAEYLTSMNYIMPGGKVI